METGQREQLTADALIVGHGATYEYGKLREWGLGIGEDILAVTDKMESQIPGVFAAGDFVIYGGKVKLITGAFNDVVLAVNSAKQYIDPHAAKMARISTENARFDELNKQFVK